MFLNMLFGVMLTGVSWLAMAAEPAPTRQELPSRTASILVAHGTPVEHFSAWVHAVGENKPLLAVNPELARNPASTIKLLTSFAALEELGPAHTWKTEAYLGGRLENGTLNGDLFLKGYGDPYLVTERLWLFQRHLRQQGLREIRGDLVIDNGYFAVEENDPGIFDGQPYRTYNVIPDALLINFHAISFTFRPNPVAGSVKIVADPMPVNLSIRNRIALANGRCGGFQRGIKIDVGDSGQSQELIFSGRFPRSCREYRLSRSVMPAADYAYGVFRGLWEEAGGTMSGGLRIAAVPDGLEPFAVADSPPLSDVIRSVNKWSNNVMTRHLLLTLGAQRYGPPATSEKGRQAVRQILAERNLDLPGLHLDNGSGLSRDTRISARGLGLVLLAARASAYYAEFVSSLPLAGLDGTMRRRFRNDELQGRMHIKTGRLDDVFAMAGYLTAASGQEYVVVTMQNYRDADRGAGEEAQSALLKWVYRQ